MARMGKPSVTRAGGENRQTACSALTLNPTKFGFGDPMTVELKGLSGTHQVVPLDWSNEPN
jgi:hypothetical protein